MATAVRLEADGTLNLIARPSRGQFLLVIEHQQFEGVVAIAHGSSSASRQPDGVCLACFERAMRRSPHAGRWARAPGWHAAFEPVATTSGMAQR